MQPDSLVTEPKPSRDPSDGTDLLVSKEQLLAKLLERIWNVLLFVVIVGGILSIQRYRFTGWLPLYSWHAFLMVFYTTCWLIHHKISFNNRVILILCLFYGVGIAGLFSFGLIGAGIWWLTMSVLIASIFYSQRTCLFHAGACLLIFIVAGIAYSGGILTIPFDANEYIREGSTWFLLLIGCVLMSVLIISAIATYKNHILSLLTELERTQLHMTRHMQVQQKAMDEIKTLRSIIPICTSCKKMRDDEGFWNGVEAYIKKYEDVQFSHGLCPDCGEKLYGEVWTEAQRNKPDKEDPDK